MVIKVNLGGVKKTERYYFNLPKNIDRATSNSNLQFAKNVLKTAKAIAPRNTGKLRESLELERTKTKGRTEQVKIVSDVIYASLQEDGFTPHAIPIEYFKMNTPGTFIKNPKGYAWVRRFTPFIKPALEFEFSNVGQIINKNLKIAMRMRR